MAAERSLHHQIGYANLAKPRYYPYNMQEALDKVNTISSGLWRAHPPDRLDYIFTRLLHKHQEIYRRSIETTPYDILAGLNFSLHGNTQQITTESGFTSEDQEVQNLLQQSKPFDETQIYHGTQPRTPFEFKQKTLATTEEWFHHPNVESIVAQQIQAMEDDQPENLLELDEKNNLCERQHSYDFDFTKTESAYWDDMHTVGSIQGNTNTYAAYNNPFDPRLTFQGLFPAPGMENTQLSGDILNENHQRCAAPGNMFLNVDNISDAVEQHVSHYWAFLDNLCEPPQTVSLVKENQSIDERMMAANQHERKRGSIQDARLNIPLNWNNLTTDDLQMLQPFFKDEIKMLWSDSTREGPNTTDKLHPGPVRRPCTVPWHQSQADSPLPADVFIPIFTEQPPAKYLASNSSGRVPISFHQPDKLSNSKRPPPVVKNMRSISPRQRSLDDSDLPTNTSITKTSAHNSPEDLQSIRGSLKRSFSNSDLQNMHTQNTPIMAAEENQMQNKTLNPLAMDYFPSFHNPESILPWNLAGCRARAITEAHQVLTSVDPDSSAHQTIPNMMMKQNYSGFNPPPTSVLNQDVKPGYNPNVFHAGSQDLYPGLNHSRYRCTGKQPFQQTGLEQSGHHRNQSHWHPQMSNQYLDHPGLSNYNVHQQQQQEPRRVLPTYAQMANNTASMSMNNWLSTHPSPKLVHKSYLDESGTKLLPVRNVGSSVAPDELSFKQVRGSAAPAFSVGHWQPLEHRDQANQYVRESNHHPTVHHGVLAPRRLLSPPTSAAMLYSETIKVKKPTPPADPKKAMLSHTMKSTDMKHQSKVSYWNLAQGLFHETTKQDFNLKASTVCITTLATQSQPQYSHSGSNHTQSQHQNRHPLYNPGYAPNIPPPQILQHSQYPGNIQPLPSGRRMNFDQFLQDFLAANNGVVPTHDVGFPKVAANSHPNGGLPCATLMNTSVWNNQNPASHNRHPNIPGNPGINFSHGWQ